MKLFTDLSTEIRGEVENESSSEKTYVIKGIFSSPGLKNRNGRVYPMHLWEENVRRYQDEIKNNTVNTLAELEHPPRSTVNPWEAVAKTRLLEMRDGKVYGEMEILNNNDTKTNQLKALIEAGVSIGVSTRGVGRLGKGQLVEEYQLITTDIVSNPSDYGANLQGFSESMILESEEFSINEGKIVCTPAGCSLEEASKVKVGDKLKKGDKEGTIKSIKGDMAQVDFDGDVYGIVLTRIKNGIISEEVKETLCSKRAKELLSIFENISKESVELSENEIKAFNIIAMHEKGLTYSELLDKIGDIELDLKKYKKDSDEYDVLNFELQGYKEQLTRVKTKGGKPSKIKESEELSESEEIDEALHEYENDVVKFQEAFGKFVIATTKINKGVANKLPSVLKEIEDIIEPARKNLNESEELDESAYTDAQASINDVFQGFKYLEKKASREEWNKLRTLIGDAGQNLAKAQDYGRLLGTKYNPGNKE